MDYSHRRKKASFIRDGIECKQCLGCREIKVVSSDFYVASNGYSSARCKQCKNKQRTEWFRRDEEGNKKKTSEWGKKYRSDPIRKKKLNEKCKQYYKENREEIRKYSKNPGIKNSILKYKFGITLEQYEQMLTEQNKKCKICLNAFTETKYIHVDHCHTTGKVRGLLCPQCNMALGLLKDNECSLLRAIKYLKDSTDIPM